MNQSKEKIIGKNSRVLATLILAIMLIPITTNAKIYTGYVTLLLANESKDSLIFNFSNSTTNIHLINAEFVSHETPINLTFLNKLEVAPYFQSKIMLKISFLEYAMDIYNNLNMKHMNDSISTEFNIVITKEQFLSNGITRQTKLTEFSLRSAIFNYVRDNNAHLKLLITIKKNQSITITHSDLSESELKYDAEHLKTSLEMKNIKKYNG